READRAPSAPATAEDTVAATAEDAAVLPASRWTLLAAAAVALVVAFVQEPGRIVDDTKLPLVMAPASFLGNALHLWNPGQYSGTVQSLTYGYFFPMGAFFALGQALHLPVWVTERLWLALLLTVAFWGVLRLAEALGIGTRLGRVLGAVAYSVAPIVVVWAATSAALVSVVLVPWVVLPLVHGARGGSPRRAAAASGVAVALMGGVNATVVIAALPLGAVWLLTRAPGPRRRALIGWWAVALVLAIFWWLAALVVQSRYGFNYLPYTETPAVTTATGSLYEAVRGASYWTAYFTLGGPLLRGAWTLVSSVGPVLGTTAVAALGLGGLARRRMPERVFLLTGLAVGVLVIAAGYPGPLGSPVAAGFQGALAGPLAVFRNISKFSPDVALPLALGLAALFAPLAAGSTAPGAAVGHPPRLGASIRTWPGLGRALALGRRPRWWQGALAVVAVAALVGASAPFWEAQLYPSGSFTAIPSYWAAAAHWLDRHQQRGTALLVPGAAFGEYTWGKPLDEPLSVLASTNWTVRSLVPTGSKGNDLVLGAVESSLDRGVPTPGMAAFLARAGIDYVVARNDLNLAATGAPPPAQVRQVLAETPGLRRVATFGPLVSRRQASPGPLDVYDVPDALHVHAVEIYRVLPAAPVVRTYPASDPVVVSGSPASLLPLLAAGVLDHRASVLAGDPHGSLAAARAASATWADTDGNQRRDMNFGAIRQNLSYVLGPGQRTAAASPGVPQNLAVVPGEVHQTVAAPLGAASVAASSYGSTALAPNPSQGPAAAFDGNPGAAWVASDRARSVGQWLQIDFGRALRFRTIAVRPLDDGPQRPVVDRIRISTAGGSVLRRLADRTDVVAVPPGPTRWLRITLVGVRPASAKVLTGFPLGAGLSSVAVPGVHFQQALRLPADEVAAFAAGSSSASGSTGAGRDVVYSFSAPVANANLDLGLTDGTAPVMVRRFTVPRTLRLSFAGTVVPQPGAALDALLPAPSGPLRVTATSTLQNLPRFGPANLVTATGRPWIAGLGDPRPALTLRWSSQRTVRSLVLRPTAEAARPLRVAVSSPAGRAVVHVPAGGGTVRFPPMTTDTLTVTFLASTTQVDRVPASRSPFDAPVGLRALAVPALGHLPAAAPPHGRVALACGDGPTVRLDGRSLPTAVRGTISQLEELQPMALTVCGGPVSLAAGHHIVEAGSVASAFEVTGLLAQPPSAGAGSTGVTLSAAPRPISAPAPAATSAPAAPTTSPAPAAAPS
ncbi:MAG: alpha-(1-_3)-arabinofuranosyltransferase domain-containing protein, partial [Acidimicrobiales bacterium]